MNTRLVKDGLAIARTFGLRHAFRRFRDLRAIEREERRRNILYTGLKPKGPVIKNILGSKMCLNMNDYGIHRDLFLDEIREPVATRHVMDILTGNDVVLEIGANIGYYALIEARLAKKVYAAEPNPRNFADLKVNIEMNGYDNIELFELAFGDTSGPALMNVAPRSNWHSFYPLSEAVGTVTVSMETVDNFLAGREQPTFARMDVEGYELCVVQGMQRTLRNLERLFIEIHAQIMRLKETRELLDILCAAQFYPEKIVKYDKPGFSRVLPNDYIDEVYRGDKGVYEVFFRRGDA
ncbi:MAG: FkbM family methyltransferase [Candidatus Omnitrophica bacterium]|nr:FkbM family methyltransferase [Candidatus Omnitrophota bacterium]